MKSFKQLRIDINESAWTRKEGKKKSGGLNEKGRKSYEKENPGSDLKAPSKKVGTVSYTHLTLPTNREV